MMKNKMMSPRSQPAAVIGISALPGKPDAAGRGGGSADSTPGDGSSDNQVYVPLKALAMDGTTPEEGDEVEATLRGKVQSLHGKIACVLIRQVNDAPVATNPDAGGDQDPSEDDLRQLAEAVDNQPAS